MSVGEVHAVSTQRFGEVDFGRRAHSHRYLCLFGADLAAQLPEASAPGPADGKGGRSARARAKGGAAAAAPPAEEGVVGRSSAWAAVRSWLSTAAGARTYARDASQWSAYSGRNKALAEAQRRMRQLPGAEEMLRGLTAFEPSLRWSVPRALCSGLFSPFECAAGRGEAAGVEVNVAKYLAYLNDELE